MQSSISGTRPEGQTRQSTHFSGTQTRRSGPVLVGKAVLGSYKSPTDFRTLMRKLEVEGLLHHARGEGSLTAEQEEAFLLVIAPCLVALAEPDREAAAIVSWILKKCPRLVALRGRRWVHAFVTTARTMHFFSARAAGDILRLTETVRRVRGITTIWAAGWTKADYDRHRRASRAASARKTRADKGATPRSLSIAALKPWQAEGIGRAEWYGRHSPEERAAIVEQLRGRIRSHPTHLPVRSKASKAVHESVHAVAQGIGQDNATGRRARAGGRPRRPDAGCNEARDRTDVGAGLRARAPMSGRPRPGAGPIAAQLERTVRGQPPALDVGAPLPVADPATPRRQQLSRPRDHGGARCLPLT